MRQVNAVTNGGFFTLVAYVPGPLGEFLDHLRQSLSGVDDLRSHITLLPPRPLRLDARTTSRHVQRVLRHFSAFEVELDQVERFPSDSIYLTIRGGSRPLYQLHGTLNAGPLAAEEEFEFKPHVTLASKPVVDANLVDAWQRHAEAAWSAAPFPRSFLVEKAVFLWQSPDRKWHRLWTAPLGGKMDEITTDPHPTSELSAFAPKF